MTTISFKIFCIRSQSLLPNSFANRQRAKNKAEKLNMEYGCHNYSVREVLEETVAA